MASCVAHDDHNNNGHAAAQPEAVDSDTLRTCYIYEFAHILSVNALRPHDYCTLPYSSTVNN